MLLTALLFSMLMGTPQLERPHLTIAQGYVESNMNMKAKGKFGEKGAWQVRECYWGKVPKDLKGQAFQAERILNVLLKSSNNNMYKAIAKYNGSGDASFKYANKVMKYAIESAIMRI
jgi:hypothetical protein